MIFECGNGGHLAAPRDLRGKAEQVGSGEACGKHWTVGRGQALEQGWIGSAHAKDGRSRPIVNALAQPLNVSDLGQSRECLSDRGKWQIAEISQPPAAFAAAVDSLPDLLSRKLLHP